ncbi:hypothetical protein WJX72_009708 [[Myrmecia] bisecta]|uniref:Protein-S-isoprenylcysteine O-methyltransferase n=1 Tax=[Myrmecia] bisecta TaxID=41462 RepID=A0AAW1PKM7_9CHLO
MSPFQHFAAALGFFHTSEFLLACIFMRQELSWSSWCFSTPYAVAMACACAEYFLERQLVPQLKQTLPWISTVGLAMVILGEAVRKAAMVTAGHNFTHTVQFQRREEHALVTHGIYRVIRHPGYAGWLLWAVGTQLLLINPLCLAGYACICWNFFRRRISIEEEQLRKFFGRSYQHYAAAVPSGIPFIP